MNNKKILQLSNDIFNITLKDFTDDNSCNELNEENIETIIGKIFKYSLCNNKTTKNDKNNFLLTNTDLSWFLILLRVVAINTRPEARKRALITLACLNLPESLETAKKIYNDDVDDELRWLARYLISKLERRMNIN